MLKRFRFGGQDSVTNPNPNIIRLAKITNPNPNIRDSEEKIRIRIRIFVTTLCSQPFVSDKIDKRYIIVRCVILRSLFDCSFCGRGVGAAGSGAAAAESPG